MTMPERARRVAPREFYGQIPDGILATADPRTRVYGWLDRRAGASGWWHSSARELAAENGLGVASVLRAIAELERIGYVVRFPINAQRSCYWLPQRAGDPPADHLDHLGRSASGSPAIRQRITSATYTSLDRKSPQKSRSPSAQEQERRALFDRAVHRVWPPDQQGALPLE